MGMFRTFCERLPVCGAPLRRWATPSSAHSVRRRPLGATSVRHAELGSRLELAPLIELSESVFIGRCSFYSIGAARSGGFEQASEDQQQPRPCVTIQILRESGRLYARTPGCYRWFGIIDGWGNTPDGGPRYEGGWSYCMQRSQGPFVRDCPGVGGRMNE